MTKYEPKTNRQQRLMATGYGYGQSKNVAREMLDDLTHCEACLAEALAEKQLLSDQLRQEIADSCQVDMDVRNEAKKVLTWQQVDGDSYAVPDVVEIVAMLVAEVERLKWQPIETAPKDGTAVLTYRGTGLIAVAEWFQEINGWCVTDGCGIVNVTHWMPLPQPPQQEPNQ